MAATAIRRCLGKAVASISFSPILEVVLLFIVEVAVVVIEVI